MNLTLFKSKHAIFAAVLAAAFVAWLVATGAAVGARAGASTTIVLWSGWTAFVAMLLVTAYSLRKYAHRLKISPEFKMKASVRAMERAETRLNGLRSDISRGKVRDRADVEALARRILVEEKVAKVLRAEVSSPDDGGPKFVIRILPTEPLGRVATWLHVHVWYGLAAGVLVWLHGGFSLRSPLGAVLSILTLLVVVTGVVGVLLWAVGPRWMTARERDFTFEDAFVQNRSLKRKLSAATAKLDPAAQALFREAMSAGSDFAAAAKRASDGSVALPPPARAGLLDALALAGQRRRVQAELGRLAPVKFWLNIWRAVHVPGTILLLGAALVHVFQVWRY